MYKVYSQLWYHLIWSTKRREPVLSRASRNKLIPVFYKIAKENDYWIDTINGVEDRLHCLISFPPKFSISTVIGRLKGKSSNWANEKGHLNEPVYWQNGYAAFIVSKTHIHKVRSYIENQESHHKEQSLDEELIKLKNWNQ